MDYEVSAEDLLIFDDEMVSNIRAETLEDALGFSESIFSNFNFPNISEYLPFIDYATVNTILSLNIADTIDFTDQTSPRVLVEEISDLLFFVDYLDIPIGGVIFENIDFSESLIIERANGVTSDTLAFTDSISLSIIGSRGISENLSLSDSFTFILINDNILDVPVGYTPEVTNLTISLTDSYETLEIDNPDFGDSDSINYKRINKDLRGYSRIIEPISTWQHRKAKRMTFSYVEESKVNRIVAFWRRNVGKPVTLSDTYGTSYTVILQNPDFEVAQVGRFNRTLSMDFYVL